MYQGFYNLTSGMLTQSRSLNVISNNMVNIQTPGYKKDTMVSTTFGEEMLYRTGRVNKEDPAPLASVSKIRTADRTYVNYSQGSFEETGGIYDFALSGKGFFVIQTQAGNRYTRNGSFQVDNEGYLSLNGVGRVLGNGGEPIQINNENFTVDAQGTLRVREVVDEETGETQERILGTLDVVDFADYQALHKEDYGVFSTAQAPMQVGAGDGVSILWKTLEGSNVDMLEEMTAMMSAQRALQSAAQVLKMYDQVMGKAVSDVGRL